MTTKCLGENSHDDGPVSASASILRGVGPSHVEYRPVALDLRGAAALQYALECSQIDLVAAQRQVANLTEAIGRLRRQAIDREREFAAPRHVALPDVPRRTTLHVVPQGAAQRAPGSGPEFCLFEGVDHDATAGIEQLLTKRIRLRRGEVLYRAGDRFKTLYAIRSGWCKTIVVARDGTEQVAGFYMTGEIIGLDGIDADTYECQATVLENTEVCQLPFDEIESLARRNVRFQHNLHRMLAHRYARARTQMFLLGKMSAHQRLAAFLLDLSQRYHTHGYSSHEFVLRMRREEIGSYLGLTLETTSRLFSRFQREGLILIELRSVKLLDLVALDRIVNGATGHENRSDLGMAGFERLLGSTQMAAPG